MSIQRLHTLLNELASHCPFSNLSLQELYYPARRRSRTSILRDLYSVSAPEAAFITQVILKDLRPLFYPLPALHYSVALKQYKSNAVSMLTKEQAMQIWDPTGHMLRAYKTQASLCYAAEAFEVGSLDVLPVIGKPIQVGDIVNIVSSST
jgi:DNA ligase-4